MAEIKCKYCGSPYCDLEKKEESFESAVYHIYCNSCKQHFRVVSKKVAAEGTWLMTFQFSYGDGDEAQFLRKSDHSIYYRNKHLCYDEMDRHTSTKFSTHTDPPVIYASGIEIWLLENPRDSGLGESIHMVVMNPELTDRALQHPAMRAIYLGNNTFKTIEIRNDALQRDVCLWLRETLNGRERLVPKKGCYIATAVYGSYDCPQVWTLRRFRDNVLASTWYGCAFIRLYYAVSPAIVRCFGNTAWFQKLWRRYLDKMIEKLQDNGVKATPYQDRNW